MKELNSTLKYLRYKTSEAYRKIRNRKNQVNTKDQGCNAMHLRIDTVPAVKILLVKLERAQGGCLGTKSR